MSKLGVNVVLGVKVELGVKVVLDVKVVLNVKVVLFVKVVLGVKDVINKIKCCAVIDMKVIMYVRSVGVDLIEPAQVSIMLGCLNIAISKACGCQPQGKQVELLGLRQQRLLSGLALRLQS